MRRPYLFASSALLVAAAIVGWGSGVIPAIIPAAVPAANKIGNSSKFQLGAAGAVSGDCASFDSSLNITGPGTGTGCGSPGGGGVPVTVPPCSSWTQINFTGSETITCTGGALEFILPTWNGSDRLYVRTPANSTPYTVYASIQYYTSPSNYYDYGLSFRKSSGGAFFAIQHGFNGGTISLALNNNGSISQSQTATSPDVGTQCYKLTNDGATAHLYYSPLCNNGDWQAFDGGGTSATGYNQVGLLLDRINAGALGTGDRVRVFNWTEITGIH